MCAATAALRSSGLISSTTTSTGLTSVYSADHASSSSSQSSLHHEMNDSGEFSEHQHSQTRPSPKRYSSRPLARVVQNSGTVNVNHTQASGFPPAPRSTNIPSNFTYSHGLKAASSKDLIRDINSSQKNVPLVAAYSKSSSRAANESLPGTGAPQTQHSTSVVGYPRHRPQLYYSSTSDVDHAVKIQWEEELLGRLKGELMSVGVTWVPDLCLAAPKPQKALVPTLVITCTSLNDSRKIERQLNPGRFVPRTYYKRLLQAGIKLAIVLDPVAGAKGHMKPQDTYSNQNSSNNDMLGIQLEIDNEVQSRPLNGRMIRLAGNTSISATFGGLVEINDCLYGLTVAHPFAPYVGSEFETAKSGQPARNFHPSSAKLSLVSDDTSESDFFDDASLWSDPLVPAETMSDPDFDFEVTDSIQTSPTERLHDEFHGDFFRPLGFIVALGWRHDRYCLPTALFTLTSTLKDSYESVHSSDWALIQFSPTFLSEMPFLSNRPIQLQYLSMPPSQPDFHHRDLEKDLSRSYARNGSRGMSQTQDRPNSTIEQAQPNDSLELTGNSVEFIGSSSGHHSGTLGSLTSCVGLDGFIYDTLTIKLASDLENGDSGSWSFRLANVGLERTNTLKSVNSSTLETTGMIIAGSRISAHMLPIDQILQDISLSFGVSAAIPSWNGAIALEVKMRTPVQPAHVRIGLDQSLSSIDNVNTQTKPLDETPAVTSDQQSMESTAIIEYQELKVPFYDDVGPNSRETHTQNSELPPTSQNESSRQAAPIQTSTEEVSGKDRWNEDEIEPIPLSRSTGASVDDDIFPLQPRLEDETDEESGAHLSLWQSTNHSTFEDSGSANLQRAKVEIKSEPANREVAGHKITVSRSKLEEKPRDSGSTTAGKDQTTRQPDATPLENQEAGDRRSSCYDSYSDSTDEAATEFHNMLDAELKPIPMDVTEIATFTLLPRWARYDIYRALFELHRFTSWRQHVIEDEIITSRLGQISFVNVILGAGNVEYQTLSHTLGQKLEKLSKEKSSHTNRLSKFFSTIIRSIHVESDKANQGRLKRHFSRMQEINDQLLEVIAFAEDESNFEVETVGSTDSQKPKAKQSEALSSTPRGQPANSESFTQNQPDSKATMKLSFFNGLSKKYQKSRSEQVYAPPKAGKDAQAPGNHVDSHSMRLTNVIIPIKDLTDNPRTRAESPKLTIPRAAVKDTKASPQLIVLGDRSIEARHKDELEELKKKSKDLKEQRKRVDRELKARKRENVSIDKSVIEKKKIEEREKKEKEEYKERKDKREDERKAYQKELEKEAKQRNDTAKEAGKEGADPAIDAGVRRILQANGFADAKIEKMQTRVKAVDHATRRVLLANGYSDPEIEKIIQVMGHELTTTAPTSASIRPTYAKVSVKHIDPETLNEYRLPWEYDRDDSNFIIIKQWLPDHDQDILYEHTRQLRERRLLLEAAKADPLADLFKPPISSRGQRTSKRQKVPTWASFRAG